MKPSKSNENENTTEPLGYNKGSAKRKVYTCEHLNLKIRQISNK
jgi:hypothetical protein